MENQAPLGFWQKIIQRIRSWFGISSEPQVEESVVEESEEAVLATRALDTRGGGTKSKEDKKKGKGNAATKSGEKSKGRLSELEEDEMFEEGSHDPKKKAQS